MSVTRVKTFTSYRSRAANFTVLTAIHPSLNSAQPESVTCAQDSEAVQSVFLPLIEDGKDVVLIAHSYGGLSGSGAAHGISKSSRVKADKKGGVIGIICITAFLIPEGETMQGMVGIPPYMIPDQPLPGRCETSIPVDVFYQDLDSNMALTAVQSL